MSPCDTCKHRDAWKRTGYPCGQCIDFKLWTAQGKPVGADLKARILAQTGDLQPVGVQQ